MSKVLLCVQEVTKEFAPHRGARSLRDWWTGAWKEYVQEEPYGIHGISLEVMAGECLGVIGANGSGKSTLLKTMAGIYSPDSGLVQRRGKVIPFLELGVGFHEELSGRDNIRINGVLLGLSQREVADRMQSIIAFAELEEHIHRPLKYYSSGMQVRLAFAIAIHVSGEVLLMDEVLAVGDEHFQGKCLEYFATVQKKGAAIVLVSHNLNTIATHCDRVALMEGGRIVEVGDPATVCTRYKNSL